MFEHESQFSPLTGLSFMRNAYVSICRKEFEISQLQSKMDDEQVHSLQLQKKIKELQVRPQQHQGQCLLTHPLCFHRCFFAPSPYSWGQCPSFPLFTEINISIFQIPHQWVSLDIINLLPMRQDIALLTTLSPVPLPSSQRSPPVPVGGASFWIFHYGFMYIRYIYATK